MQSALGTGEGDEEQVDIRYRYEVSGKEYRGTRYSVGSHISDLPTADILREYAAGKQVAVYYNRADPSESLLRRGPEAGNLFILIHLLPFHIVMFAFWWVAISKGCGWRVVPERGLGPLPVAAIAVAVAAFVAGFLVFLHSFPEHPERFMPSMRDVSIAWTVILVVAVLAYAVRRWQRS